MRVKAYTVEKIGITESGNLGTTIEALKFSLVEAIEECELREQRDGVAYSSVQIVIDVPAHKLSELPQDYERA